MAIQIPNAGTGNGQTGDNEYVLWQKTINNFSDQSNAASRLVGKQTGNLMEVGLYGWGTNQKPVGINNFAKEATPLELGKTQIASSGGDESVGYGSGLSWSVVNNSYSILGNYFTPTAPFFTSVSNINTAAGSSERIAAYKSGIFLVLNYNTVKDGNGFYKGASPVVDLYSDRIDLNHDAEQQNPTFEKLGVGDYLVKGSLGFAQEGWYVEVPKDANGNVLVAVVYEQLANNDISVKTYAKKFDDETGDIVANLLKPRDIPVGRFISLRLHELPKEPLVMPNNIQTEEVVESDK